MFIKKSLSELKLDKAIEDALDELNGYTTSDEGYTTALANVDTLMKLRKAYKPERLSRDTLAMVAGNLLGIIVIVGHERAHVVTSKALSFVMKSR